MFSTTNVEELLAEIPARSDPSESMDRILIDVGKRAFRPDRMVEFNPADFPLFRCTSAEEMLYWLSMLDEDLGLLVRSGQLSVRPTAKGWRQIADLRRREVKSRQAFVAMWFDKTMDDAWQNGFEPGIREAGYDPFRIDRQQFNEKIDDEIVAGIRRSGLLVADFTGQRQGVYFEAGLASGLGIPVIYTCRANQIKDVHFDTRQYNHVSWSTPKELRESLKFRILATVPVPKN